MRHGQRVSLTAILSAFGTMALTLALAVTAFLASFTFWIAYINKAMPGAWVPLALAVLATPLAFRAWLAAIRALSRHSRRGGLLGG